MVEKLDGISVFADALCIQRRTEEGIAIVRASQDQIRLLDQAIRADLSTKREYLDIGTIVIYYYYLGMVRKALKHHDNTYAKGEPKHQEITLAQGYNETLASVVKMLPDLHEGEEYVFCKQSHVDVMIVGKTGKDSDFAIINVSC